MPLPAYSEKSCTWKFSVHSSSYLTKARRIGKTPGRIGIRLVEGQQHRKQNVGTYEESVVRALHYDGLPLGSSEQILTQCV